jgi:hypothetical protein
MLNLAGMMKASLLGMIILCIGLSLPGNLFGQIQGQEFIHNQGQWPQDVLYMAKEGTQKIWFVQDRFLFEFNDFSDLEAAHHTQKNIQDPKVQTAFFAQVFEQTNPSTQPIGTAPKGYRYQFFHGQDTTRWASNVQPFQELTYQDFFRGIDLHLESQKGAYKYSYILKPGANPAQIRWHYVGAKQMNVKAKQLKIRT